jgi:hypothetical protein
LRFGDPTFCQSLPDPAGTHRPAVVHNVSGNPYFHTPCRREASYLLHPGIQPVPAPKITPQGNQFYGPPAQQQIDKIPSVHFTKFPGKVNQHDQLNAKKL